MSGQAPERQPWSGFPWLDLRAAELCATTSSAPAAVYRAAKTLRHSGLPDERAADILVGIESVRAQSTGPEAFVEAALAAVDPGWLERTEL